MKVNIHAVDTNQPSSQGKSSSVQGRPEITVLTSQAHIHHGCIRLKVENREEIGTGEKWGARTEPRDIRRTGEVILDPEDISEILSSLVNGELPTMERAIALTLATKLIEQHIDSSSKTAVAQ
jgi:hypothetical protein